MDIAVLTRCMMLCEFYSSLDEALATLRDEIRAADASLTLEVVPTPRGNAVTWQSDSFAFSLLLRPSMTNYCPHHAGLSDVHFSGIGVFDASVLWMLSYRLQELMDDGLCRKDLVMLRHIARGGALSDVPGRKESTAKQRVAKLRDIHGVTSTAALIAEMIRRGDLR
jgi:hypothetical protein